MRAGKESLREIQFLFKFVHGHDLRSDIFCKMLLISLHFFALLPSFSITMNFAETYIDMICNVLPTIIHGLLCTLHDVFLLQGCTESKSLERKYEGMIIPARNESDRHSQQSLQQTILYLVKT